MEAFDFAGRTKLSRGPHVGKHCSAVILPSRVMFFASSSIYSGSYRLYLEAYDDFHRILS